MSVIKVSAVAAVVVLPFHMDVYKIAQAGQRATASMASKMCTLIESRYQDGTGPSFEAYKLDLKALDAIAKDKGLADGQWMRRPYCAALKSLFKELPVSMAADAIVKREQRATRDAVVKAAIAKAKGEQTMQAVSNPVGAPAGETQERTPSPAEVLEQTIARMGVYETLYACLRILESDDSTKVQVVHMRKMVDAARDRSAATDKAARGKAITPQQQLIESIAKELTGAK